MKNDTHKEKFTNRKNPDQFLKDVNHSFSKQRHKETNGIPQNESMIKHPKKSTTRDPRKKNSGNQGVEYFDYYEDITDPIKTQSKQKDIDIESDRIVRQISNSSLFNNNLFDDNTQFQRTFDKTNPYDKDFMYDNKSLNYWTENHPANVQPVENNVFDYMPTYLPVLNDQRINSKNLYYIPDITQKSPAFNRIQLSNIDHPDENTYVIGIEYPTENSLNSDITLTQDFNIDEDTIFDTHSEIDQTPNKALKYQNVMDVPRLYSNLSNMPEIINPEEVKILYPYTKNSIESSMNVPYFLRKVPGTLNVYVVADEKDSRHSIPPASQQYAYSIVATKHPMHKINDHPMILPQSILNQPVEHIWIPNGEKEVIHNRYKSGNDNINNQNKSLIEENHKFKQKTTRIFHERNKSDDKVTGQSTDSKVDGDYSSTTETMKMTVKAQHTNVSAALSETEEVANQILEKIIDELEEIKTDRSENEQIEGYYIKAVSELLIFTFILSLFRNLSELLVN